MPPSFAHYFKHHELSDAKFVLELRSDQTDQDEPPAKRHKAADEQLAAFPAHQIILFTSEYFKAQVQHRQTASAAAAASEHSNARQPTQQAPKRPILELAIETADQLPAAEAVIASMYGVTDAIRSLQQPQLVHAFAIADMLQVTEAAEEAVQILAAAAGAGPGLCAETLEVLASIAWPRVLQESLLLPIVLHRDNCTVMSGEIEQILAADTNAHMQRILIAVFGNLQAVWEDETLQHLLEQLPLPAMQLLLNSDQLQVPSEDTVLFTAEKYADAHLTKAEVAAALSPLIRAQHLSQHTLMRVAMFCTGQDAFMSKLAVPLRLLYAGRMAAAAAGGSSADSSSSELERVLHEEVTIPAGWRVGPPQLQACDGVKLTWRVNIELIQVFCRRIAMFARRAAAAGRRFTTTSPLYATSPYTAPLAGWAWQAKVTCEHRDGGTVVGLLVAPVSQPAGLVVHVEYTCTIQGRLVERACVCVHGGAGGAQICLLAEPMSADSGWDEAAWERAGLPTSGDLLVEVHVRKVY